MTAAVGDSLRSASEPPRTVLDPPADILAVVAGAHFPCLRCGFRGAAAVVFTLTTDNAVRTREVGPHEEASTTWPTRRGRYDLTVEAEDDHADRRQQVPDEMG
jgi:hypothetical protein